MRSAEEARVRPRLTASLVRANRLKPMLTHDFDGTLLINLLRHSKRLLVSPDSGSICRTPHRPGISVEWRDAADSNYGTGWFDVFRGLQLVVNIEWRHSF